jgi:hypothetical protein
MAVTGVNTFPWADLIRGQAVTPNQVNKFVWTGSPQITGSAGPGGSGLYNPLDYGAVGNGETDDTDALQRTLDAVPAEGGIVWLPAGWVFRFAYTLFIKSNTTIDGGGELSVLPLAQWHGGTPYRGLANKNQTATVLTDHDITIRNIKIDYSAIGRPDGTEHVIRIRKAERIRIENCFIYSGSSSVALLGNDDTLELGNTYLDFYNCGSDHWDNPRNVRVLGCHIETENASQMLNFNPEPSTLAGSGHIADGLVFVGNTLISHEVAGTASQVEPLFSVNTVRNVNITANDWHNSWLVLRGDVQGAVVADNTFSDFQGDTNVILAGALGGTRPAGIAITGNVIRNPLTDASNVAVIYAPTDSALITGNVITGTAYGAQAASVLTYNGQIYGNYFEKPLTANGKMQSGFRLLNGSANYIAWLNTAGSTARMLMDTDNWIFRIPDATGLERRVLEIGTQSSNSTLRCRTPLGVDGFLYYGTASGLEAVGTGSGSALVLTATVNQVATAAAGTGVRMPNQGLYGGEITVINDSAETIKVYPTTGGNIDSLGTNVGFDLPAASVGVWVFASGTTWRTKSVRP